MAQDLLRLSMAEKDFLLFRILMATTEDESGCHLWTGGVNDKGYGTISVKGQNYYVHRLSYALQVGPIPEGLYVCHRCDTRRCVQAGHLFLGTAKDNHQDMVAKGRASYFGRMFLPKPLAIELVA